MVALGLIFIKVKTFCPISKYVWSYEAANFGSASTIAPEALKEGF